MVILPHRPPFPWAQSTWPHSSLPSDSIPLERAALDTLTLPKRAGHHRQLHPSPLPFPDLLFFWTLRTTWQHIFVRLLSSFSTCHVNPTWIGICFIYWLFFSFLGQSVAQDRSLATICWINKYQWLIIVVQSLIVSNSLRPIGTAAHQASLSSTITQSLLKFMSIELVTLSNHLILCCLLLLLPSIFPSIMVFSNESALSIRWPKSWSFSFSNSSSNKYSELISFRIDRFDLTAVWGTLKSLLQHHGLKASVLQCSDFLWSISYTLTWALTICTFVGNMMSLFFNMLSKFIKAFLQASVF